MNNTEVLEKIKGGLIVSCQALDHEPLHSSFIMSKMAKAAKEGGAVGIRANTYEDCLAIKNEVDLPLIAIYKKVYGDSQVYITPTIEEVKALLPLNPEIIAVDATKREHPDKKELIDFVKEIRKIYTGLLMADISDFEEAVNAEKLGFDIISTTLSGYTEYSKNNEKPNISLIKKLKNTVKIPVVAEGNVDSPEAAVKCLEAGAHAVVVGAAITRPQLITKKFVDLIEKNK